MRKVWQAAVWGPALGLALAVGSPSAQALGKVIDYKFTTSSDPVRGTYFTLTWSDTSITTTGLNTATVFFGFDPLIFSVVGVSAGDAFGSSATVSTPVSAAVTFPASTVTGWQYTITGTGASGGISGNSVFSIDLAVNPVATLGRSTVWFINPATSASTATGAYNFASVGASLAVVAVPELSTASSMLAGLAMLGGLLWHRRRQQAAAANGPTPPAALAA